MRRSGVVCKAVSGLALVLLTVMWSTMASAFVVTFPDSNLEAAVRSEINKPSGPIQNTDLVGKGFLSLRAAYRDIADLTGLEYCTDLMHIELYGNKIDDITPLAGLTNLVDAYLWANRLKDISVLADLPKLSQIFLQDNLIVDIAPLGENPSLGQGDVVNVTGNPLEQESLCITVPALEDKGVRVYFSGACGALVVTFPDKNLEREIRIALDKREGNLTDIDLRKLLRFSAPAKDISNLTGMEYCSNLTYLDLTGNSISNVSVLNQITKINALYLGGNAISDATPLQQLNGLVVLDLHANQLNSVEGVQYLTSLMGLYLHDNMISDVSKLKWLRELRVLTLGNNQISDIGVLDNFSNLLSVDVGSNQISDLSPLAGLSELVRLGVADNSIESLTPLSGLANLEHLDLSSNHIQNLDPLAPLSEIVTLYLDNNGITNVNALAGLPNLNVLTLRNNKISDLGPLVANAGIGMPSKASVGLGKTVTVSNPWIGNPYATGSDSFLPAMTNAGAADPSKQISDYFFLTIDVFPMADLVMVSPFVGTVGYPEDTVLDVLVTPLIDWVMFDHWEGDISSTSNPLTVVMDRDISITAVLSLLDRVDVRDNQLTQESLCNDIPALQQRHVLMEFDGRCDEGGMTYTLTTRVEGEGTMDPAPGTRRYSEGTEVQLQAFPDEGWVFDRWEGDVTGSENPTIVVMDGDKRATAVFVQSTTAFKLTLAVEGEGTLNPPVGERNYPQGAVVSITATPNEGWMFDHWEGDASGAANPLSVTMDEDKSITAVFVEEGPDYVLTISQEGSGYVEYKLPGEEFQLAPSEITAKEGTPIQLRAVPLLGWVFDRWEEDLTGNTNPSTIVMTGDQVVNAVFVPDGFDYSLAIAVEGSGTTLPEPGYYRFFSGTSVTITAVPNSGWVFDHWAGDLTGETNPATVLMNRSKTVKAVFIEAPVIYTLTMQSPSSGGTVTPPPGTYMYAAGKLVTLVAMPDEGFAFDHWEGDIGGTSAVVALPMDSNKVVRAVFRQAPFVTRINPDKGTIAGGEQISIEGGRLSTTSEVLIDGESVQIVFASDARVDVITREHDRGIVDVVVVTNLGAVTVLGGFMYVEPAGPPELGTITPDKGRIEGGDVLLIRGRNLLLTRSITFGGVAGTVLSATETRVSVVTPPHSAGVVDVAVSTTTGTAVATSGFTYIVPPVVSAVAPSEGYTGGGDLVVITGTGLANPTSVLFGTESASVVSFTTTQILVITPVNTAGLKDVTVVTPGGSSTLPRAFECFSNAGSIFCRLYNARTKAQIFNGMVRLDPPGRSAAADDTGLHSFVNVRAGSYTLTASANQYVSSTLDVSLAAGQEANYTILLQPTTAPPDNGVCGLAIKRLNAKVSETVLPLSLSESPTSAVSPTEVLAMRLTSESAVDPASVWATLESGNFSASGGTWRATTDGDDTDGWVVFAAEEPLPVGATVLMTVGATTVDGEVLGPLAQEFAVDGAKAAINMPALVEDSTIEALPEIVAASQSSVYRISPAGVFSEPLTIQIPVAAGQDPDSLAIYYFSEAASHNDWYLGDNVVGWLVPGSRRTVEVDGKTHIEVQVNHSGVMQLGKAVQFKLGSAGRTELGFSGGNAGWLSLASVLASLSMAFGLLIVRKKKA